MKTKVEVEIELDIELLAECFINMNSWQQAEFLNLIGTHFKKAPFDYEWQCCYIAKDMDKNGRDFVYTVANFLKVRGISNESPKINMLINSYRP